MRACVVCVVREHVCVWGGVGMCMCAFCGCYCACCDRVAYGWAGVCVRACVCAWFVSWSECDCACVRLTVCA